MSRPEANKGGLDAGGKLPEVGRTNTDPQVGEDGVRFWTDNRGYRHGAGSPTPGNSRASGSANSPNPYGTR